MTQNRLALWSGVACGLLFAGLFAQSAQGGGAQDDFFRQRVAPLFEQHCVSCHSGSKPKGGLSLADATSALAGGESGAAIVPGAPLESMLLDYISGKKPTMPKDGTPLKAEEVAVVQRWIETGADWPAGLTLTDKKPLDLNWWSLLPLKKVAVPSTDSHWVRNSIDSFLLAKMRENNLAPSPETDRRSLIRRLSYDLHGLPPAPEAVAAFIADKSSDAYEKLVDRLLASPRYGECWGRHWLDVVHYGETHGYDKDKPRDHAWPYRDYVINSLNVDKPYTRFVEEQIAGDVLFPDDPQALVATGFVVAGPWDFVGHAELKPRSTDSEIALSNDRDDMVMTTMSTFVSLTAHCARCHNHKFDPIRQEDYYRLQADFAGVNRADRPYDSDAQIARLRWTLKSRLSDLTAQQNQLEASLAAVHSPQINALDARMRQRQSEFAAAPADANRASSTLGYHSAISPNEVGRQLHDVNRRIAEVKKNLAALPPQQMVYAAADDFAPIGVFTPSKLPRPVHLLERGSVASPKQLMGPGALACVRGLDPVFKLADRSDEGQRRAALAHWLTDPKNMLLRRSIVNRVWQYHFGQGIVDSPNDFGRMGSKPSHPELLDWLAVWFMEHGESIKDLHRLIVCSAAYRQVSQDNPEFSKIDGENRLLWRMNRRRLDAESVHDALLTADGKLDPKMGGPSVRQFHFKDDHSPIYDYDQFNVDDPSNFRRSVYRFIVRSVPDPFMESLDCADPSILTPKRNTTLTAIQALSMFNDRFVLRQCEFLAARVSKARPDLSGQIEEAYLLTLSRKPTPKESHMLSDYARRFGVANACRVIVNSNEFLFVD
jgi:mono/diheme cytochrome c family protein